MPTLHRAAWVLPIVSPPVRDGWVLVHEGRIVASGQPGDAVPPPPVRAAGGTSPIVEIRYDEPLAILPGLVNAHTHLELSWMRGRIAPAVSMPAWAGRLIEARRAAGQDAVEPIVEAIGEVRATGTTLVGDVTNTLAAYDPLADSHLSAAVFYELLGFNAPDARALLSGAKDRLATATTFVWLRLALAPHAPYSVSPELMRAIAAAETGPISIHLGESPEEVEFLHSGTGPWRALLEDLGAWSGTWTPPACGPVAYLDRLGLVDDRLVAVHGVQLTDPDLERLAEAGSTLVTCPRSNRWVGAGDPPIERFYASGVRVAIGTDSLASVADLNLFAEMAAIRALAPGVSASRILRSATIDGALALGFAAELGSIETGKRADLIAVAVPPGVGDVEEYLLNGLSADAIRWIEGE